jgi:hypothetical protein
VADAPRTFAEFKVELNRLHSAIGSVRREHAAISEAMSAIGSEFNAAKEAWRTPSTATFDEVQAWFVRVSNDLEDLLNDMADRMQTAYGNYRRSEQANVQNLTAQGGNASAQHQGAGSSGNHGADGKAPAGQRGELATLRIGAEPLSPASPAVPGV